MQRSKEKRTLLAMDTADSLLAERNDYSADSSSDEEDGLSCVSSDVGSEWSVPEPRLPTKGFSYKYRSDFDAEKILEQITNGKDDTLDVLTEHDFAVKDADKLSPDCGSIAASLSTKVSSRTMPLPSPTKDDQPSPTNNKEEIYSDSDSLESLSSSGSMMDESEDDNNKLPDTSSPALGNFANHALLQYHLKNAQLSTTTDSSSRKSTIHNLSEPTPSGQKQKRQRTASTASAEEGNTTNSSSQGRKMIVETSADRDAYILQRVLRWEQRGVRFDWQSVARFLHIPVQTVRQRYAELKGLPLDAVPAILIHRRPTNTSAEMDMSTPEGQDKFIIQRIEKWHVKKQKFYWNTLVARLGWTTQATKDRVYELVKEGRLDSALVPSETEQVKHHLGFEQDEAQDKLLLELVALGKNQKHGNMWDMIGMKLGCAGLAARRRYTILMAEMYDPLFHCADSTASTVSEAATDTTTQPEHDIIDLTEDADENASNNVSCLHASQMGDLETYVLHCVRQQLWLLLPHNSLTLLWRQLGVELGLREIELQAMWQDKLRSVFLKDYNAAVTQGAQLSAPPPLQLTQQQCTWLCAQVYAWRGRGRGLWEGLSRVLNAPPVQVMCHWSMLTPEDVQQRWVEDAVSQRLLRIQGSSASISENNSGSGCNAWSSAQGNTSSNNASSEPLPKRAFDVYKALQAKQKTQYRGRSSVYFVDVCVDQMISAIEETDTVDRNSTLFTTPTAVAATTSAMCDTPVQHPNLSPSLVFYNSSEISAYVLHYVHDKTATGQEISWPYIANRMKISEIALRVMYEEFLQRKKQLHKSVNKSTILEAQPVVAALPPVREAAPPTTPVVVLDPSIIRWHEERVRLKAVPRSGKTHNAVNVTDRPVQKTGVEESILTPLIQYSHPLQDLQQVTQGPVQQQHSTSLQGSKQVQHQQLSQQKDQILRTDQAILHAAHAARSSGVNIDWICLAQHLGCSVFELQSRYLYLLSILQC